MHSDPPPCFFHHRIMQRGRRRFLDGTYHRLRKTLRKLRADAFVPHQRFFQLCVRLGQPNDWKRHCFLNRPALTCSHEITSEGFCWYLATRWSSSARWSSVSAGGSASRLSQSTSSNSNFSAAE